MVQKEVRKKTKIYGTVAVLSAIVLVTMIYAFGSAPIIFPPSQTPSVSGMKTFSSLEELKNYLTASSQGGSSYRGGPLDSQFFGDMAPIPLPASVQSTGLTGFFSGNKESNSIDTYSTTNIQVAGVDEADTVKTDGQYIYTVSTQNSGYYYGYYPQMHYENAVYIVNADPQNAKVVSKITLDNNTQPAGLFLSGDGNKLVVLASKYQMYSYDVEGAYNAMLAPYHSDVYTFINVYDVSNKATPILTRNFTVSGSYFNSRMIGNDVYAVVSQPAMVYNNAVTLPAVYQGKTEYDVKPSTVYYADMVEPSYYTFTSFFGIDVLDDTQQPTNMTVIMGGASTMYVSSDNVYVTYPTWVDEGQYTCVYRVKINGLQLTFEAEGSVPGYVLNQYSMDEYNGNFRIATTWEKTTRMNNVYVLNMNLTVVGRLENLAQDERIYSARFMGDKAYLVTFRQVDPFFVIDLSNPANPKMAGELKVPGYSSYLHPYDENHVIGVGKENDTVKLSLFNVTNVNAPTETARYIVEGDYSDSQVLYEPKAFLFDKQKELLVIPVSITQHGVISSGTVDPSGKELGFSTQGYFWQGAYVFKLTVTGGFELRGYGITHQDNATSQRPYPMYSIDDNLYVNRALYIGNTLYTISNAEVKLNSLTDMTQIAEISLK